MESPETAQRRGALHLAIIGVVADGGLRRSEAAALTWGDVELWADGTGRLTVQKGKNQVEPATVAVTATTARAPRDIRPEDVDLAAPVFGLTGETLGNRVRGAGRGLGRRVHQTQRTHRDGPADGAGGGTQRSGAMPGPVEERQYGGPLHPGRGGRGGAQVAQLKRGRTKTFHTGRQGNRRCRSH